MSVLKKYILLVIIPIVWITAYFFITDLIFSISFVRDEISQDPISYTENIEEIGEKYYIRNQDPSIKIVQTLIQLEKNKNYLISYKIDSINVVGYYNVITDFFNPETGYDHNAQEFSLILNNDNSYSVARKINSGKDAPDKTLVRIFSYSTGTYAISNFKVYGINGYYTFLKVITYLLAIVMTLICLFFIIKSLLEEGYQKFLKPLRNILFIFSGIFFLYHGLSDNYSYFHGDGMEYGLMLESIYNHLSPELRETDITSFKESYQQSSFYFSYLETLSSFLETNNFMESRYGYYTALNGNKYCYHFWFYVLLLLPAKFIVTFLGINPANVFGFGHALMLIIGLTYLALSKKLTTIQSLLCGLLYILSPIIFYFKWPHPEFFVGTFVFFSCVLYFEKRYFISILLAALAAIHYPPISLLIFFYVYPIYKNEGISIKNIFLFGISSFWVIIPFIFYIYHFNMPNLIVSSGYFDEPFSFRKYIGFFLDLNQGMILGIPLALILFFVVILYQIIYKRKISYNQIIIVVVLIMAIIGSKMINWNAGQAYFHRYASWISPIILVFVAFTLDIKWRKFILVLVILSQYIIVTNNHALRGDEQFLTHKKIPRWLLENYPNMYNPDPEIFAERTLQIDGWGRHHSPVYFYNKENEITKILIHKEDIGLVKEVKYCPSNIVKLKDNWIYINL